MNIKMATDTFVIQSALKYISGENADVCRLCFASTENGEISVDDNVEARTCYDNITLTIREILIDLGVSCYMSSVFSSSILAHMHLLYRNIQDLIC